jgi:hypothetical protein
MKRLVLLIALLLSGPAAAHKASDSFLQLAPGAQTALSGHWDIALRDLEVAIGLDGRVDGQRDGKITRGELRAAGTDISSYALARLQLNAGGENCRLESGAIVVAQHSDGAYARLPLRADCAASGPLTLRYALLFDLDPTHRGLLRYAAAGGDDVAAETFVLSPEQPQASLRVQTRGALITFTEYLWQGVWHIWIGADHILFLLTLLLPAVLLRRDGHWQARETADGGGRTALIEVFKVVTAFTAAHSITLSLSVLGWLTLPVTLVESAIAASVLVTALNNLWPLFAARWRLAFAFGLIHGFGFANVLLDLGLSSGALAASLAGFNIGVELGQLAIVAGFFPLAWWLRDTLFYRRGLLGVGSVLAALAALVWLLERAGGYDLSII